MVARRTPSCAPCVAPSVFASWGQKWPLFPLSGTSCLPSCRGTSAPRSASWLRFREPSMWYRALISTPLGQGCRLTGCLASSPAALASQHHPSPLPPERRPPAPPSSQGQVSALWHGHPPIAVSPWVVFASLPLSALPVLPRRPQRVARLCHWLRSAPLTHPSETGGIS